MKVVRTVLISALLLLLVPTANALNPDRDIRQLAHRSWGEKDGYPGRTEALAQTTDGFLWIGTDNGLFRFDGIHFERYVARSGDKFSEGPVRGLLALPDGSLWIAYRLGNKICVLRNGNIKTYGKADGVTSNPTTMVQDHEGYIWANTETGVIRFNRTRWEHIGRDWNFPEDVPHITSDTLFVDNGGTLWAGVNNTVLYLKQGSKRFEGTGAFAGWTASIAEAPDGTIWLADNLSYVRAIGKSVSVKAAAIARCEVEAPRGTPAKCPGEGPPVIKISAPDRLLFDHNGSLWMTTDSSGVFRVPNPELQKNGTPSTAGAARQSFTSKDGLSADNCTPILEDREGNIWVATRDGLDQFRDTALVPVALPTSLIRVAIAPADNGDVWVVGSWAYIARIHGDAKDISLVPADAFKPYRDPAGITWLLGTYSLGQWKDGRFLRMARSPDGPATDLGSWQIAGDRGGTLWAFSKGQGFLSLDHGQWKAWATPPEVARQHATNMYSDSTGRIWVSTYEGDIIVMNRGTVVEYPVKPDRPLRDVKAFAEHAPQQIWAGGSAGLVMIDRGDFRLMRPAGMDSLQDVMGIVDAGNSGLWLNTALGVIHIFKNEVDRALHDRAYRFQWERFDSSDGLPAQTDNIYPYPKAIQGTDGRIWFTATRGLAWIDPKETPKRNTVPPPLHIDRLVADGKQYEVSKELRLPPHVRDLSVDYTALSLVSPEKVRFRFKLDGQDPNWREVVNVRQVQYSNLSPGSYRFHVLASNNSGVWNEAGAKLDFFIEPAYYQTVWFKAVLAAAGVAVLWGLYRFRLHQMAHEYNVRLEERVIERTRIARDLHDTLLQSFQGLMLRLQVVTDLLPEGKARTQLERTLERADQAMAEGRTAVYELRSSVTTTTELVQSVQTVGDELTTQDSAAFRLVVEGPARDLQPIIRDEVYCITREALRNAFNHARARHIEAEISFGTRELLIRIRDDGAGIPREIIEEGCEGHYGLRGMRERAQRIRAKLDIWSRAEAGTEIELRVAATTAYNTAANRTLFNLFRRKVG